MYHLIRQRLDVSVTNRETSPKLQYPLNHLWPVMGKFYF